DSDDPLIGEGLQQLDLVVGERPGLGAPHGDHADGCTFPQHWYEEGASPADRAAQGSMLILGFDLNIGYVDNRTLQDRPPCPKSPGGTRREHALRRLAGFGSVVVLGDMMEQLTVELKECPEESVAQRYGASDDRVEHRLGVGG